MGNGLAVEQRSGQQPDSRWHPLVRVALIVAVVAMWMGPVFNPMPGGIQTNVERATVQISRQIDLAMFAYANDHSGQYPTGKSSTEVFQQLLDGNYISDPAFFYLHMAGKVKPSPGTKQLRPENVAWDVTEGVTQDSPKGLPIVFMSGYRVSYAPGGPAVPLVKPFPSYGLERPPATLWEKLFGWPHVTFGNMGGLALTWKDDQAQKLPFHNGDGPISRFAAIDEASGVVPNFTPPNFQPDGKTYIQLTPTGPLP